MNNLDLNGAYIGDAQVEKICLGDAVIWDYSLIPMRFLITSGVPSNWTITDNN